MFNVHQYLIGDNKTKDGLPFFRGEFYFKDSKDGMDTSYNGLIWSSDFELNRLRLSENWYTDGTFDSVPPGYTQTINIIIRDLITGEIMPTVFICINGKSYKLYILPFEKLRNVLCDFGLQNMNLKTITIDLETALRTSFSKVLGSERKISCIPCLFHIKQVWYRHAQLIK